MSYATQIYMKDCFMPDSLTELLNLTKLQDLLDGFCKVTGISAGIVDNEGTLQVSTVRPSLCTGYSDITAAHSRCRFNRLHLLQAGHDQGCSRSGHCPHGLVDAAEPIMLDGKQLGGLVIGQVFLKKPDFDFYCQEAKRCGYDSDEYLKAVSEVPVVSEAQFENARALIIGLTSMLAEQAMARHRAEQTENTARLHAERFVREIRRQKMQLQLYAMDDASCSDLLDTLLENALKLADSSSAYLFEYDENSCLFTLCRWFHPYASQCKIMQPQSVFGLETSGLWGEAVRQRGPVIVNPAVTPEDHTELVRYLNLPIFSKGRIVASILLGNKDSDYTEEDVRHLQLFLNGSWNLVERCKTEEELKLAKELAENALKIKSELMTSLSHELRTPLNGVIGGIQLLRFTELSAEQDEYLGIVEEASANELMLVNNLLELVQLEADGIHTCNSLFSLHSCIDEALQVFQGTARSKGIVVQKELPETMPDMVSGDKARIRQILYSLLGNGVKFTANGTVTLKVDCTTAQDRQILARFIVEDTGIGIAPEKLQHIFEPFVQADMSQTRSFGGLGLGLAICRRLTDALGGTLSVTSDPGKGSSFCLELPLQILSDRSAGIIRPGLQILLAEDDYLSSLAAEALLHAMGHQVITARNGEEAISKWERGSFDIILLDIHMPIMDGFEALQKIRARANELGRPRMPIIAQTAYARLNYHESFLSADFDGFIAKPLIRAELELTLANATGDSFTQA
jgi:signal transduction histidine kinase/ligand-binding sensor protein/ActR/RegA family two-component response regulator